METLVTLTLFAMLFAVLMTGWQQALSGQTRLNQAARQLSERERLDSLVRQAIQEVSAPQAQQAPTLQGNARALTLETSTSMDSQTGAAPRRVTLKLQAQTDRAQLLLELGAPGNRSAQWPIEARDARWRYLDAQGQSHDEWPPATLMAPAQDSALRLPALVILELRPLPGDRARSLVAAPRASPWELALPRPPLVGLEATP